MISTPRCGEPVEYYQLRRAPDRMDAVPRQRPCPDSEGTPTTPCFRPKGHPGNRHASEASYKRTLAQAAVRKRAWRRARRRENVSTG